MRLVVSLAALVLVGCDQGAAPSASTASSEAPSAMRTEAEKACAQMTGATADGLKAAAAETRALLQRELERCIAEVVKDDTHQEATPGPGLRGRTEAPPT